MEQLPTAFSWYIVFLFSVTLHEFAHAWAAKRGGDLTAYLGGQGSLNPLPHIRREPLGMVVFPIVSIFLFHWPFGYASAPYDAEWADRHPRRAAWMGLAGPASNFLLVLFSIALIKVGTASGFYAIPEMANFTHVTAPTATTLSAASALYLSMLFTLNLVLVVLNLIPLPPFDGSELISLLLSDDGARRYRIFIRSSGFGFLGFFLAWQIFSPIFRVVFVAALNVLYPGAHYS